MRWLALTVLLSGCATMTPVLPGWQTDVPRSCLPNGFQPQSAWEVVDLGPKAVATDHNGAAVVIEGHYAIGGAVMAVILTPLGPASIDPDPEDPRVPVWINPALMTRQFLLRAVPDVAAPCAWQRVGQAVEARS